MARSAYLLKRQAVPSSVMRRQVTRFSTGVICGQSCTSSNVRPQPGVILADSIRLSLKMNLLRILDPSAAIPAFNSLLAPAQAPATPQSIWVGHLGLAGLGSASLGFVVMNVLAPATR